MKQDIRIIPKSWTNPGGIPCKIDFRPPKGKLWEVFELKASCDEAQSIEWHLMDGEVVYKKLVTVTLGADVPTFFSDNGYWTGSAWVNLTSTQMPVVISNDIFIRAFIVVGSITIGKILSGWAWVKEYDEEVKNNHS